MQPTPSPIVRIITLLRRYFFAYAYFGIVVAFAITRWPLHASFDSHFIKALSLVIAFIISLLLWLASVRRLPFLTLLFFHGVIAIGTNILLENLVYKRSPVQASSLLFYGVLTAIGFAGLVTYVIYRQFSKIPIAGQRTLLSALFITVTVIITAPFAVKSYELAQLHSTTPLNLQNLLAKSKKQQPDKVNNLTLYTEVNKARKQDNLKALDYSEVLEAGAVMYLDQTQGNEEIRKSDQSNKILSKILTGSLQYSFSTIADVLTTASNGTSEADLVKRWLTNQEIAQVIFDKAFTDIGITVRDNNDGKSVTLYALLAAPQVQKTVTGTTVTKPSGESITPEFTGVELFQAVNTARRAHGVGELSQKNELCTVASIRLNQQLELGKLDNHAGFNGVLDKYKDQLPYNRIAENLADGYNSAVETVQAWEGSPGHAVLLKDGSFVWGCTAANHGFAVLIAAF